MPPAVEIRCDPGRFAEHEALYLAVREREGRVLDVERIRALPSPPSPGVAWEWRRRRDALRRLERHLAARPTARRVLDVGCGVGWMTARLAGGGARVLGIDVVRPELERAAVAFGALEGVAFAFADVFDEVFPEAPFDLAVLASSAQYFPDLAKLLWRLLELTRPDGEVVVLETPFYDARRCAEAAARTRRHYAALGVPDMAGRYHHHSWAALCGFPVEVVYDPRTPRSRLARRVLRLPWSPFPVVAVRPGGRPCA